MVHLMVLKRFIIEKEKLSDYKMKRGEIHVTSFFKDVSRFAAYQENASHGLDHKFTQKTKKCRTINIH